MEDNLSKSPLVDSLECPACSQLSFTQKSEFFICNNCATAIAPDRMNFAYSDSYQMDRGHYESQIQNIKVETFQEFLKAAHLEIKKQDSILEVGFGGGAILQYLQTNGFTNVFGIEAHQAAIEQLTQKKFPKEHLSVNLQNLRQIQKPLKFLFYLDSFEHLLKPNEHLKEIEEFVNSGTKALVVLPRADSLSRTLMGSYWPHNVADHWVFYSRKGLIFLWEKHGWKLVTDWSPSKKLSVSMVLRHAGLSSLIKFLPSVFQKMSLWIQLGEIGVVFEKK